ncbi:MAG TPA: FAD-dependent oxidoreductase, partial [Pirellulales bacterium]
RQKREPAMSIHAVSNEIKTESVWADSARRPTFPKLEHNIETDVCIVGAGIAGLTTAYLLTQSGKSVVVLDDGAIGGGMSEVTSAHLASAIDDRYVEIERLHGQQGAKLAAESHSRAIDQIETIVNKEKINCDFDRIDGYLFLGEGQKEDLLDRELEATHRAGLTGVEKVVYAPIKSFDSGPALRFPNQGQFHPLKYLSGLAKCIARDGGQIFLKSHAEQVDGGSPAKIKVGKHTIKAGAVVVATNVPINDLVAIHTKQAAYLTYVIAARVPAGAVPKALYWDTEDPYHYIRLQDLPRSRGNGSASKQEQPGGQPAESDEQLLIVGGEDHRTGHATDTHERHARLEFWARQRFPMMGPLEYTWSGQVMETIDGLAFIGRNPMDKDNVFIVTGDSGMGLTHGTIAGMLLTDLIIGRENPWEELYSPSRKTLRAAGEFIKEGISTTAPYLDWVTGGDVSSESEIAKECGAILRRGLSKVAVYRDQQGKLHEMSAVCPHLDCIVRWNGTEKTWDCPCHGSRFDKLGQVLNGPANSPLAPLEEERKK